MIESNIFAEILVAHAAQKGISVCPMKLQKLAYYCQGYYLSCTGDPLLSGDFEAWDYGPVHPAIYRQYNHLGRSVIPAPQDWQMPDMSDVATSVISFVLEKFGPIGAWALSVKTHGESPWLENVCEITKKPNSKPISKDTIKAHFTNELMKAQDVELGQLMDAAEITQADLIAMPETISSEDEFSDWIEAIKI